MLKETLYKECAALSKAHDLLSQSLHSNHSKLVGSPRVFRACARRHCDGLVGHGATVHVCVGMVVRGCGHVNIELALCILHRDTPMGRMLARASITKDGVLQEHYEYIPRLAKSLAQTTVSGKRFIIRYSLWRSCL